MAPVAMKSLGMSLKALDRGDDPNGEFEAVLSTSDLDRENEQVMAGAFDPLPASIPVFSNHAWMTGANPIGEAVPRYEGGVLKVKGRWAPTAAAQEIRTLVKGGFIKAMSAGFLTKLRDAKDPRKIVKAELIEASTAPIPVNPKALFAMAKSLETAGRPPVPRRQLVVRPKAGAPTAVERAVEACRREAVARLVEVASEQCLDTERRKLDELLVELGVDATAKAADQARYLAAYGRHLDRQLAELGP